MTDDNQRRDTGDAFREGVRSVTGVLGALVDALEQTFSDLGSGDISPERARDAARSTVQRAQETVEGLRDRFDFVTRREFDELRAEVAALKEQIPPRSAEPAIDPQPESEENGSGFRVDEG